MADPAGIAVRFSLYLVSAILFGLPCFALRALRDGERPFRLDRIMTALAVLAALLSAAQLLLLAASMSGSDLADLDRATILAVLSAGSLGIAWKVRMLAIMLALITSVVWRRGSARALPIIACAGAVALASLAWVGHGAMDDGAAGRAHLAADLLHLLAAGLWTGALAGLVLMLARPIRSAPAGHLALCARALTGFARMGTLIVATLAVTGIVNLWAMVGLSGLRDLPTTGYGRLHLAKLALFAAMLVLAAANRFRLAPGLAQSLTKQAGAEAALRRLRLSVAIETGCILAILLLVAWLGMIPPAGDPQSG